MSAIYDAAAAGDLQALRLLAAASSDTCSEMPRLKAELAADLTASAGPKGDTPLCVAARNGHVEAIRVLADELGADPNLEKEYGVTPMHLGQTPTRL